jgi:hypothetical protein
MGTSSLKKRPAPGTINVQQRLVYYHYYHYYYYQVVPPPLLLPPLLLPLPLPLPLLLPLLLLILLLLKPEESSSIALSSWKERRVSISGSSQLIPVMEARRTLQGSRSMGGEK